MAWNSGRMGPEGRGRGGEREGCQGLGPRGHGRDERRKPGVTGLWGSSTDRAWDKKGEPPCAEP